MQRKTTARMLQERRDTPQVPNSSGESFNPVSPRGTKQPCHRGCGCHLRKKARLSGYSVFVLDIEGQPLTPTTKAKARKLLKSKVAKPIWNKFGKFGVQMLVKTRNHTPKTALGVDVGTKFEGYAVVCGDQNTIAVMTRLPDKKKIVRKLKERRQLRRARRFRNCRRRPCRSDNRERMGFIAPSQNVIVQSRIKIIREMFKTYPITVVGLEDVRFNHFKKRWGKNFSTVEIGKTKLREFITENGCELVEFQGHETYDLRKQYGYGKTRDKSGEKFTAHCTDALTLAVVVTTQEHVHCGEFIVVDDTYRPVRRRLHDTQPAKGGVRAKYSTGNFREIRKGTICEFGQISGGTGNSAYVYDWDNKRHGKSLNKIGWLSHKFKTKEVLRGAIPPTAKAVGILAPV